MADGFTNPQDQAQLNQLYSALTALDADVKLMREELTAQSAAVRDMQYQRRSGGVSGTRSTASAAPSLEAEVKAIDDQIVSYTALNELIAERIRLEGDAAIAARETATAAAGAVPGATASERAAAALSEVRAAGGVPFTAAGSMQRVQNFLSGGEAAAGAGAMNSLTAAQDRAALSAKALAASEVNVREELAYATAQVQEFDTKLATTGGLSSAALQALGNGTLTLRDLGHQVTETIGKFGGWTLAAGAVYSVLGALNEVRHGAIDTSSALTGLTKFLPHLNTDAARESIVRQGQATATPLNDVGDAAQQFAKVFHNQGDVFTATHVALTAAKLDNIDLADSYRYLTAIVQETGVGAQALPGIFDQITAAQDKLGARVSQLLPAFAGSVGAVKTAGGNPSALLGLESLALVRTGLSGSSIATAFARGATNAFPTAASRGVLAGFGIDPNQGFTQALTEAIAKSHDWSGAQRRQVASAFFQSRYGSRIANLFGAGPQQLERFLGTTAAGAYPGLANRQLATTVSQPNNQLELLKVNLQAIGAELTGSKFTSPFGAMLHGLNDALTTTTRLMNVWNGLPDPMKQAASYAVLLAGALGGARRFNIGSALAGSQIPGVAGIGNFLSRSPNAIVTTQTNAGIKALTGTIDQELASASVRLQRSTIALTRAQEEAAALVAEGNATQAQLKAADEALATAEEASASARADMTFFQGMSAPENIAAQRAAMMRQGAEARGLSYTEAGGAVALGAGGRAGIAGWLGRQSESLATKASAAQEVVAGEMFTGELTLGTAAMATFGEKLSVLAGGLSDLATMAIPGAIAAFIAFAGVKAIVDSSHTDTANAIDQMYNAKTPQQVKDAYNRVASGGGSFLDQFGAFGNWINGTTEAASSERRNQLGYLHAQQDMIRVGARAAGKARDLEQQGDYGAAYHRMLTDHAFRAAGMVTLPGGGGGLFDIGNIRGYQQMLMQYKLAYLGHAVTGGHGVNPFAVWERAAQDPTNQFIPMMAAYTDAGKVLGMGAHGSNLQPIAHGYAYALAQFGKQLTGPTPNTKIASALAQMQTGVLSVIDKQVQDYTDLASAASNPQQAASFYQKAIGSVNQAEATIKASYAAAEKLPGAPIKLLKQGEQVMLDQLATKRQTAIQGQVQNMTNQLQAQVSGNTSIGPLSDLQRSQALLTGYQNILSKAKSEGASSTEIAQLTQQVNQQTMTVEQNAIALIQQRADNAMALAAAQTANPQQQEQIYITGLQNEIAKLQAAHAPSTVISGLQGQLQGHIMSQAQDAQNYMQAVFTTQLSQSNIGQPNQVQLEHNAAEAKRWLAYLQSLPKNQVNPVTLQQAFQGVYDTQGALAQWAIQEGASLIQADAALKASMTFDPVTQALDKLQGDRKQLAYDLAHNMPHSQIVADKANVHTDLKNKMEAQWQKQESTVMYLMNTYQITGAEAIARLQKIYDSMKKAGASYADLQRVGQELYNLKYGGTGLNLNTGDIHLPSTYEVKSAIMRGGTVSRRRTAAGMVADVKTDVKMTVNVHRDADVRKVAKAISDALGTSVHGLTQAAGIMN